MAKRKAELEGDLAAYRRYMAAARDAERQGMYPAAIKSAIAAWEHIDGMMQYERRFAEQEFNSVPAIDLVLEYAPFLLDLRSLNKLEELLGTYKRIERDTSDNVAEALAGARTRLWDNHRLWTHLEQHPGAKQSDLTATLGGEQTYWRVVTEKWEKMNLLLRTPDGGSYRLSLVTRMDEVVPGKCSSCGHIASAAKLTYLSLAACPRCRLVVPFVLLANSQPNNAG